MEKTTENPFIRALTTLASLRRPVSRLDYVVGLMILLFIKIMGEVLIQKYVLHVAVDFGPMFSPFMEKRFGTTNSWFTPYYGLWNFLPIGFALNLTLRRAVSAGYSMWLGLLILVPLINLGLMAVLATVRRARPTDLPSRLDHERLLFRSAVVALPVTVLLGVLYMIVSVYLFESYGATLFFAAPFVFGMINGYLMNRTGSVGRRVTQFSTVLGVTFAGGALLLFALEGAMCLVMAAPLVYAMAAFGALLGKAIALRGKPKNARLQVFAILALLPVTGYIEVTQPFAPPLREVATSIVIQAPPEVVWRYIVEVPTMPPPKEFAFRAGIAYPIRATVEEWKLGATRFCEFNTGMARERITAFEPGRLLRFEIFDQPEQMTEWSPYDHVHAPHLHGFVRSEQGEFVLTRLSDGSTRVEGRSWYRNNIAPGDYWGVFTDHFVHQIHERVLAQVKDLSESASKHESPEE